MVTGPLLVLLCAAAPDLAAWLEQATAITPVVDVDAVAESASPSSQRARVFATVAKAPARTAAPARRFVARAEALAPADAPRPRPVIAGSPAIPRGPPLA